MYFYFFLFHLKLKLIQINEIRQVQPYLDYTYFVMLIATIFLCWFASIVSSISKGERVELHRGCDHMVVGFTTTCAISAYRHLSCEFESLPWRGVLNTTLYDKVCQWLESGLWFSPGTPISSTNKTDCYDITAILLKMALNTINQTKPSISKQTTL